ncbi:unnamed protein product [Prunus armeniaca]|uniref:Uncharacterized protein n=1 Tax=Prunus armeniaca TaxID=36596 RepID=A0A6J5XRT7_PRUAR|nr:unnamed protein product [Prunus armeniaca]CAB4314932.1 unnamed protein product [Prunus armeniaca]
MKLPSPSLRDNGDNEDRNLNKTKEEELTPISQRLQQMNCIRGLKKVDLLVSNPIKISEIPIPRPSMQW